MRPERVLVGALIGMLLSLSPPALGQTQQTLVIAPETGTPGTEVSLFGEGYPDDPQDITVVWGGSGQAMKADVRIENGTLEGTAVVPESARAGTYEVEVCAFDPGSDDVYGPDDFYCGVTRFVVIPSITVSPEAGTPGAPLELSGFGFAESNTREWEVRWDDDDSVTGTALLERDGTMTGTATVPPYASEGPSSISVCLPPSGEDDVGPPCYPVTPAVEVYHPEVVAEPGELLPGTPFEVRGEEWCCPGERGEIIDTHSGEVWGEAVVNEGRSLTGTALVPEGSEPGEHPIEVCVLELCRPTAIAVIPPPPPTTAPPGVCGVEAGSFRVEPLSGAPGSLIEVRIVGSEGSPAGCLVALDLGGQRIGDVFELGPGATSGTSAIVPEDISAGAVELIAVDSEDGRALASTFFLVEGLVPEETPFPWIRVGLGALALAGLIGLGAALRRPPRIPGDVAPQETAREEIQPVRSGPPPIPARWLEARLYARDGAGEVPVAYFRSGATHRVEVRVGPADLPGAGGAPRTLRVVLTEPNLLTAPQTAEMMVRDDSPSTAASLTLSVPEGAASVDGRLLLLSGNRVVHTARLPATVGQPPAGQGGNVASIETVVRAATVPPAGAGVAAAVVVEQGRFPILTQTSTIGPARLIRLPESGAEAIETIRHRLGEIVEAPDDFAGLERESTRKLLVFLANHGRLLRNAIVADFLGEELAAGSSLQLVSAEPDTYLPLELAYDFAAPQEDAAVCPRAGDTLRSMDFLTSCPGPHDASVVCPVGFWGVSKVIERHAYQSRNELPSGFLAQAQPISGRDRIVLGDDLLVGASHRIDAYDPHTSARLRQRLGEGGPAAFVDSWTAWDAEVDQAKPSLLVLLPHTVYSDELALPGLEIGAADRRWASVIGETRMMPGTPTIVLLLGCETAVAGSVSYERFPGNLRKAGASIVVATLTDVLGRQAAPLAERLVTLLLGNTAQPVRLGESVVRLRRQLLVEGMPMVLALAVFGDADWLVGGR